MRTRPSQWASRASFFLDFRRLRAGQASRPLPALLSPGFEDDWLHEFIAGYLRKTSSNILKLADRLREIGEYNALSAARANLTFAQGDGWHPNPYTTRLLVCPASRLCHARNWTITETTAPLQNLKEKMDAGKIW